MSDRKEKIIEVAEGLIPDIWQRSSMETGQFCEKRSRELAEGFLLVIEQGIRQIIRDGGKESLEQIRYLLFSCLHSSIFSKKYLVRMELAGGGEVAPGNEEYAGREFEWEIWPAGSEGEYCSRMDDGTALEYSLEDWSVRLGEFEEGNRMQIWVIR